MDIQARHRLIGHQHDRQLQLCVPLVAMGDERLKEIARELVESVRRNAPAGQAARRDRELVMNQAELLPRAA